MTPHVSIRAGCKINLYLEITGRRADGYHELRTVFYPLDAPCDELEIGPGEAGRGLTLRCDRVDLAGPDNILHKAWSRYAQATGFAPDLEVRLTKGVPTGAGLGGGSSDAAALLRHLNGLAGAKALDGPGLNGLAAGLGADVPFFLGGVPAYAEGIGERLRPVRVDLDGFHLLLACPPDGVNTAWAYRAFDELVLGRARAHGGAPTWGLDKEALTISAQASIEPVSFDPLLLRNAFEPAVFAVRPDIRALKAEMLSGGAVAAMMSGSGAAVFGLFRDGRAARVVAGGLAPENRRWLRPSRG